MNYHLLRLLLVLPSQYQKTPYEPINITDSNNKIMTVFKTLPDDVPGAPIIPSDCTIWVNGCTSCAVQNGKVIFCGPEKCEFTKCLPYCQKYISDMKQSDNCRTFYDGCNNCRKGKTEKKYKAVVSGTIFSLRQSNN